MLVADALYKMDKFNSTIDNETFIITTPIYEDNFEELYKFLDNADTEGYLYLYRCSSGLLVNTWTETKYFVVPVVCRCTDEVKRLIDEGKYKTVPEKFYDLMDFIGFEFPFSFCVSLTLEEDRHD